MMIIGGGGGGGGGSDNDDILNCSRQMSKQQVRFTSFLPHINK
jgi:hypothetical protein